MKNCKLYNWIKNCKNIKPLITTVDFKYNNNNNNNNNNNVYLFIYLSIYLFSMKNCKLYNWIKNYKNINQLIQNGWF